MLGYVVSSVGIGSSLLLGTPWQTVDFIMVVKKELNKEVTRLNRNGASPCRYSF